MNNRATQHTASRGSRGLLFYREHTSRIFCLGGGKILYAKIDYVQSIDVPYAHL